MIMIGSRLGAEGLTGRHVLALLCGFFAVVFAVNAYFVTIALSTHTGVVANEPYRKGLRYNERIAASERQAGLGWTDEIAMSPDSSHLEVTLHDGSGLPVRGLTLSAVVGRPVTTREDVALELAEIAPGRYEGALALLTGGVFIADIEAIDPLHSGAGIIYRARKRLWLKQ